MSSSDNTVDMKWSGRRDSSCVLQLRFHIEEENKFILRLCQARSMFLYVNLCVLSIYLGPPFRKNAVCESWGEMAHFLNRNVHETDMG